MTIFLLLVTVWCFAGWRLASQPQIAGALARYGHAVMPLVLIGLGLYMLLEQDSRSLIAG